MMKLERERMMCLCQKREDDVEVLGCLNRSVVSKEGKAINSQMQAEQSKIGGSAVGKAVPVTADYCLKLQVCGQLVSRLT